MWTVHHGLQNHLRFHIIEKILQKSIFQYEFVLKIRIISAPVLSTIHIDQIKKRLFNPLYESSENSLPLVKNNPANVVGQKQLFQSTASDLVVANFFRCQIQCVKHDHRPLGFHHPLEQHWAQKLDRYWLAFAKKTR
ncbi:hypothetical protein BpHYR1_000521 [Brachionus plicatilis]|uniref:Uncharacterized protein n=1 Tax=Brachionus plicatilis TaxID=10195 RepID=A0A3M7R4T3_BRAPC|nr:hypothetical protein BpHYR1_000521 [Brachionus plicatilis]